MKNIRDLDDLELSFDPEESVITLIQMANGTGKTTTLNLLRNVISGEPITSERIPGYKPTLFDAEEGSAEMEISIDGIEYTIEMRLNYILSTCDFYTTSSAHGHGGRESGFKIRGVRLGYDFTKLFIFDAELATEFLQNNEKAEGAIDVLYNLDLLKILGEDAQKQGDIERESSSIITESAVKAQRTQLDTFESKLKKLKKEKEDSERELREKSSEREGINKKIESMLDPETGKRLEENKEKEKDSEAKLKDLSAKLFEILKNPSSASNSIRNNMTKLRSNMDALKLPKTTASDFFEELCNERYCVCGNEMNDAMRATIKDNSKKYLSEDLQSIMNSVKRSIRDASQDMENEYATICNDISLTHKELQGIRKERTMLSQSIADEGAVHDLTKRASVLDRKIDELEETLVYLTEDDPIFSDPSDNIPACERKINSILESLSKAEPTIAFYNRAKFLNNFVERVHERAMSKLKERIVNKTNVRLASIFGDEISIESIDGSIKLKGKSGGSKGQELSVGYSYIISLFEESNYKLPFVIDSPSGALDYDTRRKIAKIMPSIFDQLILFVISSERADFTDYLIKEKKARYYTVWKDRKDGKYCLKTSEKLDFFNRYQEDEERGGEK